MTKEEVKALIKAKIEGQGTNVDAGSVLPAILNGIIDLIEEGGGGTSDAVQYVPQELTEAQQMQARKNQGLYCSSAIAGGSIEWDGDTSSITPIMFMGQIPLYRIAESPTDIPINSILNYKDESQEIKSFDIMRTIADFEGQGDGFVCVNESEMAVVLIAQNAIIESDTFNGIYFTANVRALYYSAFERIENKISPDYIEKNENAIVRIHDITHNVMYYGNCEIRVEEETEIEILPGNGYEDTDIFYSSIYGDVGSLGITTKAGSQNIFLSPMSAGKALALVMSNNPKIGGIWVSFICNVE